MATTNAVGNSLTGSTGSGAFVGANTPTLITPTLGVATATSINKLAITAPTTSATLAITDGKTLTQSNTLTYQGTDGSTVNFGTGGTVQYVVGAGGLKSFQIFTSGTAQTYTRPAGITSILVEVLGGGGGGGGAAGAASSIGVGGGGGGGGYSRLWIPIAAASYTYTVGGGGAGGVAGNNAGSTGTATTFSASSLSASGGSGGAGSAAALTASGALFRPGGTGGIGTNGDLNVAGSVGYSSSMVGGAQVSGAGGASYMGGGSVSVGTGTAGGTGRNYGGGGSGANSTTVNLAGGNGADGVVIVWEFS